MLLKTGTFLSYPPSYIRDLYLHFDVIRVQALEIHFTEGYLIDTPNNIITQYLAPRNVKRVSPLDRLIAITMPLKEFQGYKLH